MYPPIAVGAIVSAALVYTAVSPLVWWSIWGADFRAFYGAGAYVRAHRADLLYDSGAQAALQAQLLHGESGAKVSLWLMPPFAAWPFAPLSRLPFAAALLVHGALGLAAAVAALVLLERELGRPSWRAMALAAVSYYPTLQWFSDGQLSSLSLLLLASVFVFLRRGNDVLAGVLLGCLAYKPQLAIGVVAALVGARRLRALTFALAALLGWAALSYATLPDATRDYMENAPSFGALLRADGYPTAGLHGLFQVSTLLFDAFSPRLATLVGIALTALAMAALVALWARQSWSPGHPEWDRRMAATLALSVVTSPHLFGYDLMLLLLPFYIVWHLYPDGTNGRPLDGGPLLAVTALGWALPLLGPALTVGQQAITRWAFGRSFALQIGVAAVLGWAWLVARGGRASPDEGHRAESPPSRRA
jgi:hypothetical protein